MKHHFSKKKKSVEFSKKRFSAIEPLHHFQFQIKHLPLKQKIEQEMQALDNLGLALRKMDTPLEAISINLEHELFR
jgi:hypothetical protein